MTRHVAAFLATHAGEAGAAQGGLARPDAILVNGGVFAPREVRARLAEVVSGFFPGAPPVRLLESPALDLAVARGAVLSALVRRGVGLRIGGGTARAFYVGIAAPEGERGPLRGAASPRGGEPRRGAAHLRARPGPPGPLPALRLHPRQARAAGRRGGRRGGPGRAPPARDGPQGVRATGPRRLRPWSGGAVRLEAVLTEIGTLELWCVATDRAARWKLEFSLRGAPEEGGEAATEVAQAPRRLEEARALVELFYGKKAPVERREVKGLQRSIEKVLGPREGWTTPVVRDLWGALHAGRARRRRSADHERIWLQLTGYCLRPGFGAPLDAWRAAETWKVFGEGLQYQADPRAWAAWWVLWRRIAGGLDAGAQTRIFETLAPFLRPRDPRRPPPKVAGVRPEAPDEMVRLAASLERIAPAAKAEAGEWMFARIEEEGPSPHLLWALGRLGARVPFHASAHLAVPAAIAEDWIARLLAGPGPRAALVFPLSQLARRSGDRARDVGEAARARAADALVVAGATGDVLRSVREVAAPSADAEQRIFGESLPAGLRLVEGEGEAGDAAPPHA